MNEDAFIKSIAIAIRAHEPLIWIESHEDQWILDALSRDKSLVNSKIQVLDNPNLDEFDQGKSQKVIAWVNATAQNILENQQFILKIYKNSTFSSTLILITSPDLGPLGALDHIHKFAAPLPDFETRKNLISALIPAAARNVDCESLAFVSAGLQRTQIQRILARACVEFSDNPRFEAWQDRITAEKKRILANDMSLEVVDDSASLDEVGGVDELKRWLHQRKSVFGEKAANFGLVPPKGVLLVGIQGCGKSLIAKAIANAWHFPLLKLDMSAIFAVSQASPDAVLQRALRVADAMSPAIIWCDEIEKAFASGADATTRRLLGHILSWLQERHGQSFFVATANDIRELPAELIRKGRFDELFFIDLPDLHARRDIFRIHLKKRRRNPDQFDCEKFASLAENFSGAEIEQVVIAALFAAFDANRDITDDDICDAIHDTVPLYKQREDDMKELREWASERTRMASNNARLLSYFHGLSD